MTGLDWPGLLRAGLCTLRLPPATFWALTPAELHVMLGAQAGPAPMTRAGLDALAQAFPDKAKETPDVRS
ncbi:MAG: phage tail assembly chaperone [Loktanella sp.]|nr:phage tail assembly chaperone [Loktanella sp.]